MLVPGNINQLVACVSLSRASYANSASVNGLGAVGSAAHENVWLNLS